MSEHAELVQQFCFVTGANEDRARFFLESSNWQLEVALSSFYENGGTAEAAEAAPVPVVMSSDDDSPSPSPPPASQRKARKEKPPHSGGGGRIMTLGTLAQDESSSDEEEGQAFYAGGSERSGQQILGPQRADLVAEMFKSVRARGAVAADEDEAPDRRQRAFAGTGYRLGQTEDDHVEVSSAAPASARSVRLRMYREGFTVDDGPLRSYTEPENASFLHFIRRGEVPPELGARGEVRVSLEDRRHEPAPASNTRPQHFVGQGYVLGSPTPPTVGVTAPVASSVSDREANERAAKAALKLDESQPNTTIQIRLADGGRLVARFNLTHTVQHIRDYITTAMPEYQMRSFVLMTTFPSAELKEPAATIVDAKLQNSLVVQRLV